MNRYINPAADLNCGSADDLQLDWAGVEGAHALPLSAAQLGIWFAAQLDACPFAYNIGEYIEIGGSIDPALFEQSLRQVVNETETLRVRITEQDGEPRQVIGAQHAFSLPVIDVSTETDARAAAEAWMRADLARPIAPTHGPLFAFALLKAAPTLYFWYARYHHIIMDAYGMSLLARRAAEVYSQLSLGRRSHAQSFGSLTALLKDDAAYRASEQFWQDRKYWCDRLADRPGPV